MTNTIHADRAPSAPRLREGFSLIEIIVAMSMIAIAFTSLMALQVKITQRQALTREQASRNAILLQEVNRVESMRYDTLATMLVSDTSFSTAFPYIRRYTLTTGFTPATTAQHAYTDVSIRIIPYANRSDSVYTTLRRTKTPSVNPLFTP